MTFHSAIRPLSQAFKQINPIQSPLAKKGMLGPRNVTSLSNQRSLFTYITPEVLTTANALGLSDIYAVNKIIGGGLLIDEGIFGEQNEWSAGILETVGVMVGTSGAWYVIDSLREDNKITDQKNNKVQNSTLRVLPYVSYYETEK